MIPMKLAITILKLMGWSILLWAALIIISTSGKAQAAEQILQQATRAHGGEKALQKANALQAQGRITRTSDGKAGQLWLATARPNLYGMVLDFDGFILSEGSNGKSGWRRDSRNGLHTLTGRESLDFQAAATFRNQRWLEHKKQKARVIAEATTTLNGKPVNVLNFVTNRGMKFKLFFDAASGLLVREEFLLGDSLRSIEYRAYRNVDGVQEPFALTICEGEERFEVQFDTVTHTAAPRTQFDFPQRSIEALPDLKALVQQVTDNQAQIDRLLEQYTWTQDVTSRELDKNGVLKEKNAETQEITHYRGFQVERTIARNGLPLTADELEKENKRVEKRLRDIEKRANEREAKLRKGQTNDAPEPDGPDFTIGAMLRGARLLNPRREQFRGRAVIVFDFAPNPDFKPKNMFEKFSQKSAGAVWIDAKALQVARLEGGLTEGLKFGGFLGAVKGAAFLWEQTPVNDEIWLPTFSEFNLGARALFFGLSFNQTVRYRNYQRFKVDTEKEKLKVPLHQL